MKSVFRKLRSSCGESLAETLIAVLVIAVALTMLAGMITSTSNLIRQSDDKLKEYYTASEKLETFSGSGTETGAVEFQVSLSTYNPNLTIPSVNVQYAENAVFSSYPVIAYQSAPET